MTKYSCCKSSLEHRKIKCLERKDVMQLKSGAAESSWSGSMGSVAVRVQDKILELEKIEEEKVPADEKRLAIEDVMAPLVVVHCVCCKEWFPTFDPGYQSSEEFGVGLFSLCSSVVASWEACAPLDAGVHGVTDGYCGTCLRCQKDIVDQRSRMVGFRNCMDPCWNFPRAEYAALFGSLTFTEAVLVALYWMQVNVCSFGSSLQHKFMGNFICFAEERANVFEAMGAMRQYRARDRVNSSRHLGPGRWDETCFRSFCQDAADDEKRLFSRVTDGYMVFVSAVQRFEDGELMRENVSPWLQMMPRHASALHYNLVILLRKIRDSARCSRGLRFAGRWLFVLLRIRSWPPMLSRM